MANVILKSTRISQPQAPVGITEKGIALLPLNIINVPKIIDKQYVSSRFQNFYTYTKSDALQLTTTGTIVLLVNSEIDVATTSDLPFIRVIGVSAEINFYIAHANASYTKSWGLYNGGWSPAKYTYTPVKDKWYVLSLSFDETG